MTLLEQIRASIRECLDTRAGHMAVIDSVIAAAEARDDSALSDAETAQFNEARSAVAAADADLAQLQEREAELVALEEARAAADAVAARFPAPNGSPEIRVGAEPVVYRDGGEYSFLQDAYRSEFGGDWQARERLERHQRMALETRDVGTGAFGALVPPQYLVDMFAPIARAGRPIANSVRRLPLPAGGMTFNVPRGTTGTTTAVQAAENDAVSETNFDETTLAVSLQTIAGQQDVSRQALERGVGIDLVVFGDLASHYATVLDTSVYTAITGTAGIEAVTYTDASPTVAEFFPKLAD
ncbi:MAG: phage major capsid protein, partial [Acidimicrobiales bacterium]